MCAREHVEVFQGLEVVTRSLGLPIETKVERGTFQRKSGASVELSNSGKL